MSGFDSGFGKYINDQIISKFPKSIEIHLEDKNSITINKIETKNFRLIRKKIESFSITLRPNKKTNNQHEKRHYQIFLNQFLLTVPEKRTIDFKSCKFYLKGRNTQRIFSGIELSFIHSLIYIRIIYLSKENHKISKSFFAYVIDFSDFDRQAN